MHAIIVTGSAGLIGSETVKRFAKESDRVVGVDNDMRAQFFVTNSLAGPNRRFEFQKHGQLFIRGAMKCFPSLRCASATKIVRPQESNAETQPNSSPALLRLSAMISKCFTKLGAQTGLISLGNI